MLIFLVISVVIYAVDSVEFQFVNKEKDAVWVGIHGNVGKEHMKNGGFILNAGAKVSIQAPDDWAGRFWGRTHCDPKTLQCLTGDCGNGLHCKGSDGVAPVSRAEISLNAALGLDFYDVSLVDGFNLPITIEPVDGRGGCRKADCSVYLNNYCPDELKLYSPLGTVIGCKSACMIFNTDQYCCRGVYGSSETCQVTAWPVNYADYFKTNCPNTYSYAFDDFSSTFTCRAKKYIVTFGI